MAKGNGRKPPSYKDAQKNVSVYLGKKGDWQDNLLQLLVSVTGKSESQLFRECYVEKLISWGVLDSDSKEPIEAAVDKLKSKVSDELLPNVLDR